MCRNKSKWNTLWKQNMGIYTVHGTLALGANDRVRQTAYRALFRSQPDKAAIVDIRLGLNQSQPSGNGRSYAKIEKMTGIRRAARGRPRRKG